MDASIVSLLRESINASAIVESAPPQPRRLMKVSTLRDHSVRSAIIGSMRIARTNGRTVARATTTDNVTAATVRPTERTDRLQEQGLSVEVFGRLVPATVIVGYPL
jgi:hypothetical protein